MVAFLKSRQLYIVTNIFRLSFIISIIFLFYQAESYDGPDNQAAIRKNNVTLTCRNSEKLGRENIWMFSKSGSLDRKTFYRNSALLPNFGRFTVTDNSTDEHSHELVIQDTSEEDAGLYYCITSVHQYTAHLIILGNSAIFEQV